MSGEGGVLRLDGASRQLRRVLRPLEWVVLEDVALDAAPDGAGAWVAATSARAVAEHLGITPGSAAKALARLRAEGLVALGRRAGEGGRFGLSAYQLAAVPGLVIVTGDAPAPAPPTNEEPRGRPRAARPRTASPRPVPPRAADRHMATPQKAMPDEDLGQLDLLTMDLPLPPR